MQETSLLWLSVTIPVSILTSGTEQLSVTQPHLHHSTKLPTMD
jgi:hypothetical protein